MANTAGTSCCTVLPEPHRLHIFTILCGHVYICFSTGRICCVMYRVKKCVVRLNSIDLRSLLSRQRRVYGGKIKPSTIAHPQARTCCFANQKIAFEDVIMYSYVILVYRLMPDALNRRSVNGEGVMTFSYKQFHTSAIWLAKEVSS